MATYGSFKYGGAKYGASSTDDRLSWGIEVDWDGDGVFDGVNEAGWAVGFHSDRGRGQFLRMGSGGKAVGFYYVPPGVCRVRLVDPDGRYDPYNTGSPLYPYITPEGGKLVRVRVKDNNTGTIYPVFCGRLKDINPSSGKRPDQVELVAYDGLADLQDADTNEDLVTSQPVHTAISTLLTSASWPAVWGTDIRSSTNTIPYWWSYNKSFYEAINRLALDFELGYFFAAADGAATFYSRATSLSPTYSHSEADMLKRIDQPAPWTVNRDRVRVTASPLTESDTTVLWTLPEVPQFSDGESREFWGSYTYNSASVPASSVVTPVSGTDWTANTEAGGGGIDKTSGFTMVLTVFGEAFKATVTNNSGGSAYLTLCQVRGKALYCSSPVIAEAGTGTRVLHLDSPWMQASGDAQDYADYLKSLLAGAVVFPTYSFENRFEQQFGPDLFEPVTVSIPTKSISGTMRASRISHDWLRSNGQAVKTTFRMEPQMELTGYWQFTAQINVTTYFPL